MNTCLGEALGLKQLSLLTEYQGSGLAETMAGELEQTLSPRAFAAYVKQRLGCEGLFYVEGRLPVQRVGLCSGAGGGLMPGPEAGIQAFVTGEAKHHELLQAEAAGITLVAAGHYDTEAVAVSPLAARLAQEFPSVAFQAAKTMRRPARYL